MKPLRNAQYTQGWELNSKAYRELCEEFGYEEVSWAERQLMTEQMSAEEYEAWQKAQHDRYNLVREAWNEMQNTMQEKGQIQLNIRNNELDSFCSVFQKADRILTGMGNLAVGVYDDNQTATPAWSDGKSVTFNLGAIKQITPETLMSLHGLNYHEVSHLLYTPRVGSELGAWVKEEGDNDIRYRHAFNLLEDFRAEAFLIAKYPSVAPFLTAVVSEYAINQSEKDEQYAFAYLLVAGRPHMPREIIGLASQTYAFNVGVALAKEFYMVANEYRTLVFPRDYARAKELISSTIKFLPTQNFDTPSGCTHRPVMRNGRPETGAEQERVISNMPSAMSDEELEKLFSEIMSGEAEADLKDKSGEGEPSGLGYSKSGEGESGSNSTPEQKSLSEQLAEALQRAVDEVKQDSSVAKKVWETAKAIRNANSSKAVLPKQSNKLHNPKQADVVTVRLFAEELERLRIDADPDWDREKPTGKLNVRRAMQADVNDINKLFDRWSTGNDDYDIEACILLDRSGSMWHDMDNACKASWILKRGLEKINASVTVMTFNDTSRLLYSADQRATSQFATVEATGSTDPEYALYETERIMSGSKKKTKLMFLLTDGQFYGGKSDEAIKRLKGMGVHTNLVFLSSSSQWAEWGTKNADQINHGVDNLRIITKPLDLVKVAKDVVRHHLTHA